MCVCVCECVCVDRRGRKKNVVRLSHTKLVKLFISNLHSVLSGHCRAVAPPVVLVGTSDLPLPPSGEGMTNCTSYS